MKKILVFIFIGFVAFLSAGLTVQDSVIFGGDGDDVGNDILALESGIVVGGYTSSTTGDFAPSKGVEDFLLVKFNDKLELEWSKTFGGSGSDIAQAVAFTEDGGFILAGLTDSSDGDVSQSKGLGDFWVVKVSSEGELVWEKSFGGSSQDHAYDVVETRDGNFLVVGYTRSNDGDVVGHVWGEDFWIIELNSSGDLLRQWTLDGGNKNEELAREIVLAKNGGFFVLGYSVFKDVNISCNYVNEQAALAKIDDQGNVVWYRQYGGMYHEDGFGLLEVGDRFIMVGDMNPGQSMFSSGLGGKDFWIVGLDDNWEIAWSKNYGGSFTDIARAIVQIGEDDYLVAGYSSSSDKNVSNNRGMTDGWLMVIDSAGKLKETLTVGGSKDDFILSLSKRGDSVFFTGYSESSDGDLSGEPQEKDLWVFSTVLNNQ